MLSPFLRVLFSGAQSAEADASRLFGDGAGTVVKWVMDLIVGSGVTQRTPMQALYVVVGVIFIALLLKNVALYLQNYTATLVEGLVTRDLRNDIYGHLLRLGFPFFQRTRAGQIISRVTGDVDQMRGLVTSNLIKVVSATIQALVLTGFLLSMSWRLTLVAMIALPPMILMWARFRKRLRRGVLKVLDAVGEVAGQIQETVSGVRLVKASGAEPWEDRRFRKLTQSHYKALARNDRWRKFFSPATEVVTSGVIMILVLYGSHLVLVDRSMAPNAFLTALLVAARLMTPVKVIAQYPSIVQPGLAAAERAFELLDTPVEVMDRPGAVAAKEFRDALRFEKVGFEYIPGQPVLSEIELTVRPGEVVALVGPSGAGKSTMADLVPRFYDPTAGRLTLDGVDLRELRLRDLRGLLGIVTQETILFHDTVRSNIAYGVENATQEEVENAARAANAHEFIAALPQGYDTVLGERGTRLSGGQRQRVAIARALLRNPPVLILDEATSALDTESERLVQQAIEQLMADRTVLVIAHRLSTIRRADQIIVLEAGRIVERGTHEELLAHDGTYRRLHDLQFGALDPAAAVDGDGQDASALPADDALDSDDPDPQSLFGGRALDPDEDDRPAR
ncbi:ABC transporter ATP-binding protein [Longimicrobium terrae]|uniref:Subfamily B ATP-binding cassette protein MsbA n=1 Tax=Longimicrobium terrae TaxID=1639882 RepID=A0A841GIU2_9BACT|nr:ABC transporter ATP-binding protein [Longimicrobium terrae]MBB4634643.1 subfamily B ATP-binding cassette protein MsbA [Longimicrobium terrae]MBB6068467.1 subfamily B ATP-binding cassette protein MsbA [Longimicrobium terrae]